jgi:hypothetical protein
VCLDEVVLGCYAIDDVHHRKQIAWVPCCTAACCACNAFWSWVYQWSFHKLMSPLVAAEILVSRDRWGAVLMMP